MVDARHASVEWRRSSAENEFRRDIQGGLHVLLGTLVVTTVGETSTDVKFPVAFVDRPFFTFGGGVHGQGGTSLQSGVFPVVSAAVVEWKTVQVAPSKFESEHFVGAKLAVVAVGPVEQQFFVDFRFEGTALVGKTSGIQTDSVQDEI